MHTWPGQKISLGHQSCFGGRAAWLGSGWSSGAVGLGTEVETPVGVPVVVAARLVVPTLPVDEREAEVAVLILLDALVAVAVVWLVLVSA